MRSIILAGAIAALAFLPAGCAGTKSSSASQDPATVKLAKAEEGQPVVTDDPNNPQICHSEADSTTRVRKYKVCRTQAEWDEMERKGQKQIQEQISNSGVARSGSN